MTRFGVGELLGINKSAINSKKKDLHLWRRFGQIEKMDVKEKRQILQLLETFIEKEQLKEKVNNGYVVIYHNTIIPN